MPRYVDDHDRRDQPSGRQRDRSADLAYSHEPATPYPHTIRMVDNDAPPMTMPGAPAYGYSPPPLDQQGPHYGAVSRSRQLDVPRSQARPRSMPPEDDHYRARSPRRTRRRSGSGSDYSDNDGPKSPMDRALLFVNDNFSSSTAGLGVSVLGALVGGLAAREAVEVTGKQGRRHHHDDPDYKRNQMIGTVVGAAVGALGANAFEKRIENNRERERRREQEWERHRWPADRVLERREVVARSRSRGGDHGSGQWRGRNPIDGRPRSRGTGVERKVDDDDGGSWESVQDWVYDDRKSGGLPDRRADVPDHHH
ncbi:uncharacterized protein B0I36DRAFT_333823 [Microdochium trichocladiopsis]|uniref:Glycine zipper 2TM domain-containing protein n=1 Tax=Microdochium trichocladiopsis TaxID=1682393 RepID=A0A9P8XVW9_9PEZI|nr:uncharacterized protein B0I36DRAFT_333823 [Microdochium trichocladiopsis]KAH7021124.1 hypothetical protein B0I36DRAFT_333823 [Microdochium trichocladiopsis]